mgnify:CR=1 FL=1
MKKNKMYQQVSDYSFKSVENVQNYGSHGEFEKESAFKYLGALITENNEVWK